MKRVHNLHRTLSLSRPTLGLLFLVLLWSCTAVGCGGSDADGKEQNRQEEGSHDGHDHEGEDGHNHEGEDHEGHDHGEGEEHESDAGLIRVTPQTMSEANIRVAPVTNSAVRARMALPAVVAPHGDGVARVGTIIPGRVAKLYAAEGAFVAKGAKIAEIETMEIGKARAEYLEAVAMEKRTRQGLDRQQRLAGDGVGAQKTLEESTAEFERAQALRREAEAHLQSLGIDPKEAGSSFANRLAVRAPIAGVIARRSATLGEYIAPDEDLFTIVNTGTVWIDAQGTPKQAAMLGTGGTAFARTPSGERVQGRVVFISPTVDPESKTVTIRIEAPNKGGLFRPGAFVTAEFESGKGEKLPAVPAEAVEKEGNRHFVYRLHEPGSFERVEVDVREKRDEVYVIDAGLEPGDEIAQSGIFYLRSIRMQGELSEHHH